MMIERMNGGGNGVEELNINSSVLAPFILLAVAALFGLADFWWFAAWALLFIRKVRLFWKNLLLEVYKVITFEPIFKLIAFSALVVSAVGGICILLKTIAVLEHATYLSSYWMSWHWGWLVIFGIVGFHPKIRVYFC